jgi:hypothetical protein
LDPDSLEPDRRRIRSISAAYAHVSVVYAEPFIEEAQGDEPELAAQLKIEERELEAGGLDYQRVSTSQAAVKKKKARRSGPS